MNYRETLHGTHAYQSACALRERVLRIPIGMVLRPQDTAGENEQFHFVALNEQNVVLATVTFKPLAAAHAKLRQMAVSRELQGQGVGAELVRFAEQAMRHKGFRTVETSARHTAIGFYQKLGYRIEGDFYEEVGLPTIKMVKSL